MNYDFIRPSLLSIVLAGHAFATDPVVTNVRAQQKPGTMQVLIDYDLSGTTDPVWVSIVGSSDGGTTWTLPMNTVSGIGGGISPGRNLRITWNAGADWNGQVSDQVRFRVTASDDPPTPSGMVLIPAGSFQMGDSFSEGSPDERPVHTVFISAFYMDKYEVTKALWDEVRAWGASNGYTDLPGGGGKSANHPVHSITWYAMVKWCNARSQKAGLTPCYTVSGNVYKTGSSTPDCNWSANGYRLPTEAEWEKAARGGLSGKRFPWGDTISHSQANYESSTSYSYDVSPTRGYHPTYNDAVSPYTSPVGSFAANGYGLFDMAGNLWEWCWDRWSDSYYGSSPGTNPRGPASGSYRQHRGGGWINSASHCRAASRGSYSYPFDGGVSLGFRSARSAVP